MIRKGRPEVMMAIISNDLSAPITVTTIAKNVAGQS